MARMTNAFSDIAGVPGGYGGVAGSFAQRRYEMGPNANIQRGWWRDDERDELGLNRQRIGNSLLSKMASGSFDFSSKPSGMIPRPNYIGTGGVYSQGQVDAMSNLQRGNLQQQAGTATQNFASTLGSRGFSPQGSPLMDFYQQSAMMRANAGAAKNETELNFGAAKANRDAQIAAGGVNANMYGSYADAMSRLADITARGQMQGQSQKFDLLRSLLSQG
jgi:hypothetical protein